MTRLRSLGQVEKGDGHATVTILLDLDRRLDEQERTLATIVRNNQPIQETGVGAVTVSGTAMRGDIIVGQGSPLLGGTWKRVTVGASGTLLRSNGTEPVYATPSAAGLVTGTGTTNNVTKWTDGPGGVIGDSLIRESGSNVTVSGNVLPSADITWDLGVDGTAWTNVWSGYWSSESTMVVRNKYLGTLYDKLSISGGLSSDTNFLNTERVFVGNSIAGASGIFAILSPSAGGNFAGFKCPTRSTDDIWLLPTADASGFWKSDGSHNMSRKSVV